MKKGDERGSHVPTVHCSRLRGKQQHIQPSKCLETYLFGSNNVNPRGQLSCPLYTKPYLAQHIGFNILCRNPWTVSMFFHSVYFLNKIKSQFISFFILSVTHYKKEKFSYKITLFHILTKRKYMSPLF